jgi:hypothetical protein
LQSLSCCRGHALGLWPACYVVSSNFWCDYRIQFVLAHTPSVLRSSETHQITMFDNIRYLVSHARVVLVLDDCHPRCKLWCAPTFARPCDRCRGWTCSSRANDEPVRATILYYDVERSLSRQQEAGLGKVALTSPGSRNHSPGMHASEVFSCVRSPAPVKGTSDASKTQHKMASNFSQEPTSLWCSDDTHDMVCVGDRGALETTVNSEC